MGSYFVYDQIKKEELIRSLTDQLTVLRTKAEVSQEQLALVIGISRQTYSTIETKKKQMSWQIYMALILYFNSNEKTKKSASYHCRSARWNKRLIGTDNSYSAAV
ncbi:MAG: helix-turn-helix transcriptional regulator [Ruminococcus sp.]